MPATGREPRTDDAEPTPVTSPDPETDPAEAIEETGEPSEGNFA